MIISSNELVAQARNNVQEIDVTSLSQKLDDNLCLIDVREPAEFAAGRIPGAVCMPRGVLEMQLANYPSVAGKENAVGLLAQQDIYLICRSGGRSALAAESLIRMGFNRAKVYSLAGGMMAWEQANLPLER